MTTWRQSFRTL